MEESTVTRMVLGFQQAVANLEDRLFLPRSEPVIYLKDRPDDTTFKPGEQFLREHTTLSPSCFLYADGEWLLRTYLSDPDDEQQHVSDPAALHIARHVYEQFDNDTASYVLEPGLPFRRLPRERIEALLDTYIHEGMSDTQKCELVHHIIGVPSLTFKEYVGSLFQVLQRGRFIDWEDCVPVNELIADPFMPMTRKCTALSSRLAQAAVEFHGVDAFHDVLQTTPATFHLLLNRMNNELEDRPYGNGYGLAQ